MSSSLHGMKPAPPPKPQPIEDDDWETDPDFVNNLSEKQSRWGAKTVEGSGHQESIMLDKLRQDVLKGDEIAKEKKLAEMPKPSEGYGGKFGVQTDRIDKCAAGFDYKGKVEAHPSQRDYAKGFGGTYGIQTDRVDKSAVGWDSREQLVKHESQTDYKKGFGGQFGVQTDRKDKSAAGWEDRDQLTKHGSQTDYKKGFGGEFGIQTDRKDKSAAGWEERDQLTKHESQTDYKKGFGGQFGVQSDRKDKSAAGWEEHEQVAKHESQTDYKKGFGGQFGLQTERQDKSAVGWEQRDQLTKHASQTDYKKGFGANENSNIGGGSVKDKLGAIEGRKDGDSSKRSQQSNENVVGKRGGGASSLRSKFEQMALQGDQQNAERAREERERRKREDEELRKRQAEEEQQRQKLLDQQWAEREQNEELNGGQPAPEQEMAPKRASFPKTRPNIGVRLPFATAPAVEEKISPNDREEAPKIEETSELVPEQNQPPPIKVLPTSADQMPYGYGGMPPPVSALAFVPKRRSEEEEDEQKKTQEEEDEWKEEEEQPIAHGNMHPQIISSAPAPQITHQQQSAPQNAIPASAPVQMANQPHSQPQYELPPCDDHAGQPAAVEPNPPADPAPSSVGPLMAIALYEYEQQDDDEIGFDVNDVITDIEQIDAGWWRGTCKGRFGLFPANYVQLMHR